MELLSSCTHATASDTVAPDPLLLVLQAANGLGQEDTAFIIEGMAQTGAEPTYCMGDDIPLPVLSTKAHPLYNYFKQRFAQARPFGCFAHLLRYLLHLLLLAIGTYQGCDIGSNLHQLSGPQLWQLMSVWMLLVYEAYACWHRSHCCCVHTCAS